MGQTPDHRVKLGQAEKHLNALHDAIQGFIESEPYRTITKFDTQTRDHIVQIKSIPVPPPDISAMVGDVLFNLRSALDHLVYAIATRAKVSGDKTAFPIFLDPQDFAARAPQVIGDLPAQAQASIQWLQPYHSANPPHHALWLLHDLNRIDKHRLLNVVQTVTHRSDLTLQSPEGVPITVMGAMAPPGGFENGAVIGRYRLPNGQQDMQMGMNFKLACDVCFGAGPADRFPVMGLLRAIYDGIWKPFAKLERFTV